VLCMLYKCITYHSYTCDLYGKLAASSLSREVWHMRSSVGDEVSMQEGVKDAERAWLGGNMGLW